MKERQFLYSKPSIGSEEYSDQLVYGDNQELDAANTAAVIWEMGIMVNTLEENKMEVEDIIKSRLSSFCDRVEFDRENKIIYIIDGEEKLVFYRCQ